MSVNSFTILFATVVSGLTSIFLKKFVVPAADCSKRSSSNPNWTPLFSCLVNFLTMTLSLSKARSFSVTKEICWTSFATPPKVMPSSYCTFSMSPRNCMISEWFSVQKLLNKKPKFLSEKSTLLIIWLTICSESFFFSLTFINILINMGWHNNLLSILLSQLLFAILNLSSKIAWKSWEKPPSSIISAADSNIISLKSSLFNILISSSWAWGTKL